MEFQTYSQNVVDKKSCAVYIRNVCKRYGNGPPTLNNLNMTVKSGTTYGLLGSSGCGKTTILSCVVGLRQWDSGELLVLGVTPDINKARHLGKKLGYMPQEIALYDQLTIEEIIRFYGMLYNSSYAQVQERWKFLKGLLEFPPDLGLIRDMSGGQRRRASLALALIHDPKLLLLDEPTVGLDPLLRQKIWSYLHQIVKTQNTTIIITTHYIEEARFSDQIGIMRNGKLIAEDSPTNLLHQYNCTLVEEVVSKLCHRDEQIRAKSQPKAIPSNCNWFSKFKSKDWKSVTTNFSNNNSTLVNFERFNNFDCESNHCQPTPVDIESTKESCNYWETLYRIYGLTIVTTLTFLRHPVFLVMLMVMPTIQCCLAVATMGSRIKNMHFGVVNQDVPNWITECESWEFPGTSCDSRQNICGYLNTLKNDSLLILDPYDSEATALEQVRLGKSLGYLTIPSNFSQHLLNLAVENLFASNETLEGSRLKVRLDQSNYIAAYFVINHLYKQFKTYTDDLALSCGMSKAELKLPIEFRKPVYGTNDSDDIMEYMFPGHIVMSLCSLTGILSALIFISDYKQGTLSRSRVAGLNITDIICSQFIIQSVVTVIQIGILTLVNTYLLDTPVHGSFVLYCVFSYLAGIFAVPLGLFFAIVCREEVEVFVISIFIFPIFITFGGTIFPSETTTLFWQRVGNILPVKIPVAAFRSVLIRHLDITHSLVWPGLATFGIWIVVSVIAAVIAFRVLKL